MRNEYHYQLDLVSGELVAMTRLVGVAMEQASQALLRLDLALAEQVIAGDDEIDNLASKVEADCFQVSALQQPVATDLRIIVAALRISGSLERMGDLAVHVARAARAAFPSSAMPEEANATLVEMAAVAQQASDATGAMIANMDAHAAGAIAAADREMSQLHGRLAKMMLSSEWKSDTEAVINVTLISRFYERYTNHAVSIAKRVVYVVTGEPYRSVDPGVLPR